MRAVSAARDRLVRDGHFAAAGLLSTIAASARSRRPVRVSYDGRDWRLRWNGDHTVYSDNAVTDPMGMTEGFLPLFFHDYAPRPGDTVVDCGSGIGTEIRALSDLVGTAGRVVAIEAGPDAFRRLTRMVADLPVQNVEPIECAVSNWTGTHAFAADASANGVADRLASGDLPPDAAPVLTQVDTLAAIVERLSLSSIDYLRMNIEGEELRALEGMGEEIRRVRNLCVSCHDFTGRESDRTLASVRELLEGHGFHLSQLDTPESSGSAAYYVFARRHHD